MILSTFGENTWLDGAKQVAWENSGLDGTIVPGLVEAGLTIGREAGIAYLTAGLGNLATCSRFAYAGLAATKVALGAREAYEGYQNIVAASAAYNEGDYLSAGYHTVLASLNVLGLKDVMKFPAPKCFPAGTLVSTATGLKPIETIRAGETVWAFDLTTGTWHLKPVLETYEFDDIDEIVEITVEGEVISSTKAHPFWVIEGEDLDKRPWPEHIVGAIVPKTAIPGRWVDSHDLRAGDVLLLKDRPPTRVRAIQVRDYSGLVYNFAVEDLACYAVGECRVLVHNSCGDDAFHRVYEEGKPKFQLRKGEEGLSVFDANKVTPDDILPNFRPGSRISTPERKLIESMGLRIEKTPGNPELPAILRDNHFEILPGVDMTRNQFKQALRQLENAFE